MANTALPPQVIVNEEFVRRYIAPADPLGRRLTNGDQTYTIAGVVRNSTYDAFGEPPTPAFFFSWRDRPRWLGEIHLRARPGSETLLASEVQRAVREIDASLPVYNIRTMAEHIERNLFLRKIPARMFAGDCAVTARAGCDRHLRRRQLHRVAANHRDRRPHRDGRHLRIAWSGRS